MVALPDSQTTEFTTGPGPLVQLGWKLVAFISVLIAAGVPTFFFGIYLLFLAEMILIWDVPMDSRADHAVTDLTLVLVLAVAALFSLHVVNQFGLWVMLVFVCLLQTLSHVLTKRYLPMLHIDEASSSYTSFLASPCKLPSGTKTMTWESFIS